MMPCVGIDADIASHEYLGKHVPRMSVVVMVTIENLERRKPRKNVLSE